MDLFKDFDTNTRTLLASSSSDDDESDEKGMDQYYDQVQGRSRSMICIPSRLQVDSLDELMDKLWNYVLLLIKVLIILLIAYIVEQYLYRRYCVS